MGSSGTRSTCPWDSYAAEKDYSSRAVLVSLGFSAAGERQLVRGSAIPRQRRAAPRDGALPLVFTFTLTRLLERQTISALALRFQNFGGLP